MRPATGEVAGFSFFRVDVSYVSDRKAAYSYPNCKLHPAIFGE
jgi:hypothetical protein